jgi:hypothetical protein
MAAAVSAGIAHVHAVHGTFLRFSLFTPDSGSADRQALVD